MRYAGLVIGAMALVGITACGGGREARVVPDVRGQRLDRAERLLADQRLDWDEQGSDGLGVLVRSNWTVCGQTPPPGKLARRVVLHVGKRCGRQSPATSRAPRMPWVESSNLHDAEEQLDSAGIAYTVRTDDGDPVVIERLWTVCYQTPAGGTRARFVELQVAHECWE